MQYSWSEDRLWRKNRRPGNPCDGVDLNRNYNDHWGGVSGRLLVYIIMELAIVHTRMEAPAIHAVKHIMGVLLLRNQRPKTLPTTSST